LARVLGWRVAAAREEPKMSVTPGSFQAGSLTTFIGACPSAQNNEYFRATSNSMNSSRVGRG
jgi:hypothetical protein